MLEQKLVDEKAAYLKSAYDIVFEDNAIKEEQRSTTLWQGCFGMRAPALHSASRAKRELKIKPWLTP